MTAQQPLHPVLPITPAELRQALAGSTELAVVDVRDPGVQARDGYILRSVNLALSTLELNLVRLLPRRAVPIVVVDGGDGALAKRAAAALAGFGYTQVRILAGGTAAWQREGGELFTGTSALSKGFGEFVELHYSTPHISAEQLHERLEAGEDLLVVDGRTLSEFEAFSIPGAYAIPNGELLHRLPALLPSPTTTVVVNCAGRTRSIIGAQTLINAGLPNPVVALENGTMDWLKAGFSLQHGVLNAAPAPGPEALGAAVEAAERLRRRFDLALIDSDTLARYQAEAEARALYLLDVRTSQEYRQGHLPGAQWAEAGQLVQGVDQHVGIQHARIVLIDDEHALRAAVAGSWLAQLGWGEVSILPLATAQSLVRGAPQPPLPGAVPQVPLVTAQDLAPALRAGEATLLDLADSPRYEAGHIPGAWFAVRAKLLDRAASLPGSGPLILTSPDGVLARYAVAELAPVLRRPLKALAEGTAGWVAAGLPLDTGPSHLWDDTDDVPRSPYHTGGDRLAAFKAYLDWEVGLVEQIQRDGTVGFFTHAPAA
ncbi:rhodanese-like domain-containing protein [Pseudomonas typographi]|uniref:Sulfurtransferase n=1 Tax=Pseudomonas typographi TaxID=2715964 RepID=A0ABR7YX80_9PSED|nr:rhodanese-like domain-containing protein [Pseudomonas typographi]MBD1597744.1 sulfurtransferase [Pseudomonas typographi]